MKRLVKLMSVLFGCAFMVAGCSDNGIDELPVDLGIGTETLAFANEYGVVQESKTISISSNYDWDYTVDDTYGMFDIERVAAGLEVTPHFNYAKTERTAVVTITSSSSLETSQKSVTLKVAANDATLLAFLADDVDGWNDGFVNLPSMGDDEPVVLTIPVYCNVNEVTVTAIEGSVGLTARAAIRFAESPLATRAATDVSWLSYDYDPTLVWDDVNEVYVSMLTLTMDYNDEIDEEGKGIARSATVTVVASAEGNDSQSHSVIITQAGESGEYVLNPTKMMFDYYEPDAQTLTIIHPKNNAEYWTAGQWKQAMDWFSALHIDEISKSDRKDEWSVWCESFFGMGYDQKDLGGSELGRGRIGYVSIAITEELSANTVIFQFGAPEAKLELSKTSLLFQDEAAQYIQVSECSFIDAVTKLPIEEAFSFSYIGENSDAAKDWFTVEFDPANGLSVKPKDTPADTRKVTLRVTVGDSGNTSFVDVALTQFGSNPSIELSEQSLTFAPGDAPKSLTFVSNVESVKISNADEVAWCTPSVDGNVITVSVDANKAGAGTSQVTYTVEAESAKATFTVTLSKTYNVGDLYMVNGKAVGVVYKTWDNGNHGKVFSLTVNNDVYPIQRKSYYDALVICDFAMGEPFNSYGTDTNPSLIPCDVDDGRKNRDLIKKSDPSGWAGGNYPAFAWVEQLAQKDALDWYIPAINELIELVNYMEQINMPEFKIDYTLPDVFTSTEKGGYQYKRIVMMGDTSEYRIKVDRATMDPIWDAVQKIYTDNTDDQYVVFRDATGSGSDVIQDAQWRNHVLDGPWIWDEDSSSYDPQDNRHATKAELFRDWGAGRWTSSTLYPESGMDFFYGPGYDFVQGHNYRVFTIWHQFFDDDSSRYYNHILLDQIGATNSFKYYGEWGDNSDYTPCGSVHPIMQF